MLLGWDRVCQWLGRSGGLWLRAGSLGAGRGTRRCGTVPEFFRAHRGLPEPPKVDAPVTEAFQGCFESLETQWPRMEVAECCRRLLNYIPDSSGATQDSSIPDSSGATQDPSNLQQGPFYQIETTNLDIIKTYLPPLETINSPYRRVEEVGVHRVGAPRNSKTCRRD